VHILGGCPPRFLTPAEFRRRRPSSSTDQITRVPVSHGSNICVFSYSGLALYRNTQPLPLCGMQHAADRTGEPRPGWGGKSLLLGTMQSMPPEADGGLLCSIRTRSSHALRLRVCVFVYPSYKSRAGEMRSCAWAPTPPPGHSPRVQGPSGSYRPDACNMSSSGLRFAEQIHVFLVAGAALPSYLVRERVDFRVQRTCEGEANNAPCKATLISKPANGTILGPLTCEGLGRLALPVQQPVGAGRSTSAEGRWPRAKAAPDLARCFLPLGLHTMHGHSMDLDSTLSWLWIEPLAAPA
jgi:hypothetical protein